MKNFLKTLTIVLYFIAPVVAPLATIAQPFTIRVGSSPNMEDGDFPHDAWNKQNSNNVSLAGASGNTPQTFGAKGDGVTDDTAALQALLNRGGEIFIPSANYVATNLFVTNSTHIRGGLSARILFGASGTNWVMATGANTNIQIENLIFDGGGTTIPGSIGTRNGLQMNLGTNGNSWVKYCEFVGLNGIALQGTAPGGVLNGQLYRVGYVEHCTAKFCGIGFYQPEIGSDSAEYSQWSECEAVSCFEGFEKTAGNVVNLAHRITSCTTGVRLIGPGGNGNHGNWVGCTLNHNTTFIYASNIATGENFNDCIIIAGGSIALNTCNGVTFNGCQLNGPPSVVVTNSPVGAQNAFIGNKFQGDWPLFKSQITNDGGAFFFSNWGWNNAGVTNSSDGSFGNPPFIIKPIVYPLVTAQTTGAFSSANGPASYFDIGTVSWTASNPGGVAVYIPAQITNPSTQSVYRITFLNTNTSTLTLTNLTRVTMYFGNSQRQYTSLASGNVTLPTGYTEFAVTNIFTNSTLPRVVGFEAGQGNIAQTVWCTRFLEQPIQ